MKRSKYSETPIVRILKWIEVDRRVKQVCCEYAYQMPRAATAKKRRALDYPRSPLFFKPFNSICVDKFRYGLYRLFTIIYT